MPALPAQRAFAQHLQADTSKSDKRKTSREDQPVMRHHIQARQAQNANDDWHVENPAKTEDGECGKEQVEGAMPSAPKREGSHEQHRDYGGISTYGAFLQIPGLVWHVEQRVACRSAVVIRHKCVWQSDQTAGRPFFRALSATLRPRASPDVFNCRQHLWR